jgi:hypothetical protein
MHFLGEQQISLRRMQSTRDTMAKIMGNMRRSKHSGFRSLIKRGEPILQGLESHLATLEKEQDNSLGMVWLVPLAWIAGTATVAAATKWITDAYQGTAEIEEFKDLSDKYGPDKAAQILKDKNAANMPGWQKVLLLGVALVGVWLLIGAKK